MPKNAPIAEATPHGAPSPPSTGSGPPTETARFGRPSDLFVRAVAIVSLLAAVLGVLVLPGLLGSVGDTQAVFCERITAIAGYLSFGGLLLLTSTFGYELILRSDLGGGRYALLTLAVVVVGLAAPSVSTRLIAIPQALLAVIAAVLALVAAAMCVRAPHTRAPAFVLGMVGLTGLFRALAWSVAALVSEGSAAASAARGLATLAIVAMGLSQLVAVAYFATRGRIQGRVVANLALVLGFVVTYLAAKRPAFAGAIGAILGASIARGAPSPEPYGLLPVAHYLLPTALFLGIVALLQRNQVTAITTALALALASQGRLDVPLPALFVLVAGMLLVRASRDDRAMWTDLVTTRAQQRADDASVGPRPTIPKNVVVEKRAEVSSSAARAPAAAKLPDDRPSEPPVAAEPTEPRAVAASVPDVVGDGVEVVPAVATGEALEGAPKEGSGADAERDVAPGAEKKGDA